MRLSLLTISFLPSALGADYLVERTGIYSRRVKVAKKIGKARRQDPLHHQGEAPGHSEIYFQDESNSLDLSRVYGVSIQSR